MIMPLPKIKHPLYAFKIPSTKETRTFRPFLVKEEKLLLMAKTSEDPTDVLRVVKQIVNNCCIDEQFDVDKLSTFDLEYLFVQIRAVSVGDIVKVSYKDNDDQKIYNFEINLKEVDVKFPEDVEKIIKITDAMGIVMKWPSATLYNDNDFLNAGDQSYYELIVRCIDKIYDGEDLYNPAEYSKEEVESFLDDCGVETFEKIQKFMASTPKLYYKIEYVNSNGKERKIELTSLTDFFTLR